MELLGMALAAALGAVAGYLLGKAKYADRSAPKGSAGGGSAPKQDK